MRSRVSRQELLTVSTELSSDAVKSRIRKEERKLLKPLAAKSAAGSSADDNARFLEDQHLRQSVCPSSMNLFE